MDAINLKYSSTYDPNKENILILFKYHSRWNVNILQILELEYNVLFGYFTEIYHLLGTLKLCEYIQKIRTELHIRALIIDPEWCDIFNIATVELLDSIIPVGLLLLDDAPVHEINRILASRASFVLTPCPFTLMKYRELDIESDQFMAVSEKTFITDKTPPDYDVLWYGYPEKADRPSFIEKLQNMTDIKVKIYTGPIHEIAMSGDLSYEELNKLIGSAKIIISLTKSDFSFRCNTHSTIPRPEMHYFVGKFIEIGFVGRLCLSQYSPMHQCFHELTKYMKEFHTPEQMEALIRYTLASGRLEEETEKYSSYIKRTFNNQACANKARKLIDRANKPHWRPITRVSQAYYNIAIGAIAGFKYNNESMRGVEADLFNQACARVRLDFTVKGETPTRTSGAKIFIAR